MEGRRSLPLRRRLAFAAILVVALYLCFEALLWVGLEIFALRERHCLALGPELSDKHRRILADLIEGKTGYLAASPELGWTIRPDGRKKEYRANAQGIRGDREYAVAPAGGVVRIACFGDSFTHCDEVANDETWEARLDSSAKGLEVMNFGVGGYGPGQAWLRYRHEGRAYGPHVVLIGLMSENLNRSVSVFRPFYHHTTGLPLAKPRFVLEGDGLALLPNPLASLDAYRELLADPAAVLPRLAEHDAYMRYARGPLAWLPSVRLVTRLGIPHEDDFVRDGEFDETTEAFEVTARIVEAFYAEVIRDGAVPVVLLFPKKNDLQAVRDGSVAPYAPFARRFARAGMRHLDVCNALTDAGDPDSLFSGTHYNPKGNALVARFVHAYLQAQGLATGGRRQAPK